ncbi:MAG: hypothetical protein QM736_19995 [Vicinamibacterales bacterium]
MVVMTGDDIEAGQNVWQSMGGMEQGSIWGHGSYVAPDWTADWLHRESVFILDRWSTRELGIPYAAGVRRTTGRTATAPRHGGADQQLRSADASDHGVRRARGSHRREHGLLRGSVSKRPHRVRNPRRHTRPTPHARDNSARSSSGSSWAASTNRPGADVTYTSNWPHEDLVGNRPTGEAIVWTGVSIILLLGGIGCMASWYACAQARAARREHSC